MTTQQVQPQAVRGKSSYAPDSSSEVKFEIGHALFIDIVGYLKLLINEQSEQLQKLKEIVRWTERFRLAEAEGKLLRLPTGDGGALVSRKSPEARVLCPMQIARALKSHPKLRVRIGIHTGPVNEISDLNEQANIAGAGINRLSGRWIADTWAVAAPCSLVVEQPLTDPLKSSVELLSGTEEEEALVMKSFAVAA